MNHQGSPWAKSAAGGVPPFSQDLCDAEKKKLLDEFMALDGSKRDTMIKAELPRGVPLMWRLRLEPKVEVQALNLLTRTLLAKF